MIQLPFLVAANLVLITRFFCYFRDHPTPRRAWVGKTAIEIAGPPACFEFGGPPGAAILVASAANLAGFAAEKRAGFRNSRRLLIGPLERALLCGFILQGQYGAIGFILAANAFARSKALDDRAFAEYVLIGTLLSGGLALCIGLMAARQLAAAG